VTAGTTSTPEQTTSADPVFDAVIVAGARSERLGGVDKAMLEVDGVPLLARAVVAAGGACRVIVVGPRRAVEPDVVWCEEQPAGGGPAAAFAAGLALTSAPLVLLLAADLPFVAGAVAPLLAALGDAAAEVAVLVEPGGRPNYLASAWRRDSALLRLGGGEVSGRSMRSLLVGLDAVEVPDGGGWALDCDTWDALEAARQRAASGGQHHIPVSRNSRGARD
jgi:molybdopterin-guanine dinucleotide biosynthesis protein A